MPTWVIILAIVAVILVAFADALIRRSRHRKARLTRELRARFGSEYDRLASGGSRKQAERELVARERRHAELDITPLSEADRTRYALSWQGVQLSFLDQPATAVRDAEALIGKLMAQRGYPAGETLAARAEELSVEHAHQLENLREAQAISAAANVNKATTEDLRQAMVRYRSLFADLLQKASDDPAVTAALPEGEIEAVRVIPSGSEH